MRQRWLMRTIALVLLGLVAWGLYNALRELFATQPVSWSDLAEWRPSIAPLLVSLVLLLAVYLTHALLWRRIMSDLGIARPSFATTLRVYFVSSLARYIPVMKLGQLAGLAVLSARAGMPAASAAAAAVLGQFGFLSTGMLFLGLTLPEWRTAVAAGGDAPAALPLAVGAGMLVVCAVALWLLVATPAGHGFRTAVTRRVTGRAAEKVSAAFALADRVRVRTAVAWALGYAGSWVLLGLAFVTFVGSFVPDAWTHARVIAGTVAAAYLLGYLAFFLPAGLGAREAVMIVLLSTAIAPAAAIVISVASRIWFTVAELLPLVVLPVVKSQPMPEREEG